ncbi:uncharacterized protein LOC112563317 [Pomacea canaliculata]|uniref:uncharacterized protein LOC112563317 n=1 Tax=Pomacea canaliculata TaxID=400727 RepID=UPI000D73750B|nr:uncharacterized protein LOC112563317 [Pomacea canaliculata]
MLDAGAVLTKRSSGWVALMGNKSFGLWLLLVLTWTCALTTSGALSVSAPDQHGRRGSPVGLLDHDDPDVYFSKGFNSDPDLTLVADMRGSEDVEVTDGTRMEGDDDITASKRWRSTSGRDNEHQDWVSIFRSALLDVSKRRHPVLSINTALVTLADMLRRSEFNRQRQRHIEHLLKTGR